MGMVWIRDDVEYVGTIALAAPGCGMGFGAVVSANSIGGADSALVEVGSFDALASASEWWVPVVDATWTVPEVLSLSAVGTTESDLVGDLFFWSALFEVAKLAFFFFFF